MLLNRKVIKFQRLPMGSKRWTPKKNGISKSSFVLFWSTPTAISQFQPIAPITIANLSGNFRIKSLEKNQ